MDFLYLIPFFLVFRFPPFWHFSNSFVSLFFAPPPIRSLFALSFSQFTHFGIRPSSATQILQQSDHFRHVPPWNNGMVSRSNRQSLIRSDHPLISKYCSEVATTAKFGAEKRSWQRTERTEEAAKKPRNLLEMETTIAMGGSNFLRVRQGKHFSRVPFREWLSCCLP